MEEKGREMVRDVRKGETMCRREGRCKKETCGGGRSGGTEEVLGPVGEGRGSLWGSVIQQFRDRDAPRGGGGKTKGARAGGWLHGP